MWICANCGEHCEEQFDSCWKCQALRTPECRTVETLSNPRDTEPGFTSCPRCRSTKVIPNVSLVDSEGRRVMTEIQENPDALVFKGRHQSKVTAFVCGECGFMELYASNPTGLYEAMQPLP